MRVLIVGCGYVGLPLGAELVRQGHEVFGIRRGAEAVHELKQTGIHPLNLDITQPADLVQLPLPFDWVVHLVSSGKGGLSEYQKVFLEGTRHLINCLRGSPLKKFVYTSSTSVYGQIDGSPVKETHPTEPAKETSQVLVQTEQLLLQAVAAHQFPAIILRVAGIYGPQRTYWLQEFLKNEVKIPGHGERHLNMIHRDDLVGIITAILKSGRAGEIYNVVDDEPVHQLHFFRWLSETLGRPMPPFVLEGKNGHKRGLTNKKVLNRKLKMELGYRLKYPTFRQGYSVEIQRLEQSGELELGPQPEL